MEKTRGSSQLYDFLTVSLNAINEMSTHALHGLPNEVCGLLVGSTDLIISTRPLKNIAQNQTNRYLVDPMELIDIEEMVYSEGQDIIGIYHSHPDGTSRLSSMDLQNALPNWVYGLVSFDGNNPKIRFWKLSIDREKFIEIPFKILAT